MDACEMSRVWAMPNADTFDVEPIRKFVWKYLQHSKVSIDPFARNKNWATHTNDLNPKTTAEFHMDVMDFLERMLADGVTADVVIFDPPYSPTQLKRAYEDIERKFLQSDALRTGGWKKEKDAIAKLVGDNGVVLSFGWNSTGMGEIRGFTPEELILVAHGAAHNDTICMAERRKELPLFGL